MDIEFDKECSKSISRLLLREMKDGRFSECGRLPRETVLAETFGISRTQLRDALAQLEREGYITRRHGVGTIINRHVLQVKNRMDMETEFMDIIRQSGYTPNVSHIHMQDERADAFTAKKMKIPEGSEIVRICRICTADDKPAIYCEDVLEKRYVKGDYTLKDLEPPIFIFLQKFCNIYAYMDLTQLHAVLSNDTVSEALEIPKGTPVLNMQEVDFDIDGNIILYSNQYFVDELFEQTVMRKKF